MPEVRRARLAAADAKRDSLDSMLVPVHPRHSFAPHLRQAIETVGTKRRVERELRFGGMHAEGMIRTRENDALDALAAGPFVNLVQADQVVFDEFQQGPLDAGPGEV